MSIINKQVINRIRSQQMDRKSFLQYSGIILISLLGFKTFTSILQNAGKEVSLIKSDNKNSSGYGGGGYGR